MELREGVWEDQSCWIVGGGPSLKYIPWTMLGNKKNIIVINRAFIDVPHADLFFTEDLRIIEQYHTRQEWKRFKGLKVFHALDKDFAIQALVMDPAIKIIARKRKDKYWSKSFADGLSYSSNSGVGAINLACLLGATTLHLLGFDCRTEGRAMQNYHDDYKSFGWDWEVGSNQADNFKSDFEGWVAPNTRDRRILNIVSTDYPSALKCWPKLPWNEFDVL